MKLRIIKPGMLTTVQDMGRRGLQKFGVSVSGAMDTLSLRLANMLCGNRLNSACLEMTMNGATLGFDGDGVIALCGAEMCCKIDGEVVPMQRPVLVSKGSVLQCGRTTSGCRTYLAVAGSLQVSEFYGSRSTDMRLKQGGVEGRALLADDIIRVGAVSSRNILVRDALLKKAEGKKFFAPPWLISLNDFRDGVPAGWLRVLPGPQYDWFSSDALDLFYNQWFQLTPFSDRMGLRFTGDPVRLKVERQLVSEAVSMGTIQMPPDGQAIILMSDRQTTGGYPKLAQVITVDHHLLAQLKPGDKVRFVEVDIDQAETCIIEREQILKKIMLGVSTWIQST